MKRFLQRIAAAGGYRISRIHRTQATDCPFEAMRRLLGGEGCRTIFDVGAHHGVTVRAFRRFFPGARIHAFEPSPESFEVLKAEAARDGGIFPMNVGLADRAGTRRFHSNRSSMTNSLLAVDEAASRTWGPDLLDPIGTFEARFTSVDAVMAELGIPEIDILKLDVQGAEPLVMAGAANALRLGKVRVVYSEIIAQPTYVGQHRFDHGLGVFYDHGLDLYGLYGMDHMPNGRLRCVDAIFTRRDP
jgi:FkbM family methyltransferase